MAILFTKGSAAGWIVITGRSVRVVETVSAGVAEVTGDGLMVSDGEGGTVAAVVAGTVVGFCGPAGPDTHPLHTRTMAIRHVMIPAVRKRSDPAILFHRYGEWVIRADNVSQSDNFFDKGLIPIRGETSGRAFPSRLIPEGWWDIARVTAGSLSGRD